MTILEHVELTDELIEEARAYEGMPLRIEQWNHEATLDTIRHWAWGIGDMNPLWYDEQYAARTTYGTILAPPTFLSSVYTGLIGVGMRGIHWFGIGFGWRFTERVQRGDRLTVEAKVGPLKVHEGKRASRLVIQTSDAVFKRQDGTIVGYVEGRTLRVARPGASGGLKVDKRERRPYAPEELEAIRLEALSEPVRGAEPRYWEDVAVGEQIPAVVKGPIGMTDMVAYYAGNPGTPRYKSVEIAWRYKTWARDDPDRLPNNIDPSYYAEDTSPSEGHVRDDVAKDVGMPAAYNNGSQTNGWLGHCVTNWMGDEGFLAELDTRLREPVLFGDTVWCRGVVTDKREGGLVDIDLSATNQIEETCATAKVVVQLPSRSPAT